MSTYKDPMQYATMEGFPGSANPLAQDNLAQLNNRQSAAIKGDILEKELAKHRQTYGTEGIVAPDPERELTYGEKAVGLSFNPSGDPAVHRCKVEFAAVIDRMNDLARPARSSEAVARMAEIAIEHAQTAQMWAVKAITWRG